MSANHYNYYGHNDDYEQWKAYKRALVAHKVFPAELGELAQPVKFGQRQGVRWRKCAECKQKTKKKVFSKRCKEAHAVAQFGFAEF